MRLSRSDLTFNNVFGVFSVAFCVVVVGGLFVGFARIASSTGVGKGHVELDETNNLYRTRVPGGWVYYFQDRGTVAFVPEIAPEGSSK